MKTKKTRKQLERELKGDKKLFLLILILVIILAICFGIYSSGKDKLKQQLSECQDKLSLHEGLVAYHNGSEWIFPQECQEQVSDSCEYKISCYDEVLDVTISYEGNDCLIKEQRINNLPENCEVIE